MSSRHEILVAEDDPIFGNFLTALLEENGYKVSLVRNGEAALKLYSQARPDLFLADMILPVKNGAEAIRVIRNTDQMLPIIAISGAASTYLDQGIHAGASVGLAKPFDSAYLLDLVRKLLGNNHNHLPEHA